MNTALIHTEYIRAVNISRICSMRVQGVFLIQSCIHCPAFRGCYSERLIIAEKKIT